MGLAESQRLLARLYTDAALRARFAADPVGVAGEFGLTSEEAKSLASLPIDQLDDFAGSLIRKRRGEVESLLPMTLRALEAARFASMFRRFVGGYVPIGIKKHRDDAVAFATFLAREVTDPPWLGDLARFEAASILARDPARRWTFLRLRHHPLDLARASSDRSIEPRPRWTWIVWFRLAASGRLRRVIFPGGWNRWRTLTNPLFPGRP
jgi:hypothetical protein